MKPANKPIKTKTLKVYKTKRLNNASFTKYNLNDYQVFLHLISKIGGVDEVGRYIQPEQLSREYKLTAKEFSDTFNININSSYRIIKKATDKIRKIDITIQGDLIQRVRKINVISMADYYNKEGFVVITLNSDVMEYLAQVKQKFVLYNLKEVANFGSLYSTRLYELIQEFKDTGVLIKSVDQLRQVFATENKFPDYNNFKRKTFAHAIQEINSQYEIDLTFNEIKDGRKVVAIQFLFKPTYIIKGINPYTGEPKNTYVKPKQKKIVQRKQEVIEQYQDQLSLNLI